MKQNPDIRARYLHNEIKDEFKKRKITIAVGNSDNNFSLIGTSEKYLHKDVLNAMSNMEVLANPNYDKHAEEDIIIDADDKDIVIKDIGASRSICLDCENLIKTHNITSHTAFSGKKSKNRRSQYD